MASKQDSLGNLEEESEEQEQEAAELQKNRKAGNDVLREEMDKLRSDVDKISQELRSAVDELKKSIVDIRSAIAEIENPFNLLRSVSSEEDLKKLEKKRLPPGVKSLVLGKSEKGAAPEEEKPEQKPQLLEEEKPELPPLAEPEIEEPRQVQPQFQPKSAYLDWVWSLLDSGLSADDVLQFAQACESAGYLPVQSSEHIYSLALACEKVKSKGFNKSQMLLSMYRGAVTSGIRMGSEDFEKIISIAEGLLKKRVRGGED
jgi:hypothetical protein